MPWVVLQTAVVRERLDVIVRRELRSTVCRQMTLFNTRTVIRLLSVLHVVVISTRLKGR